jgi:hypothetical protein
MRMATTASLLGLASLGLVTGCPDRTISEVNPEQGRVESKSFPINLNRDVDILFVVDDSGSMADKQQNLRDNFPNFINVLNTIQGGLPDIHLGVVSSDMGVLATDGQLGPNLPGTGGCTMRGDDGRLQTSGAAVTGTFISDIKNPDNTRSTNYTGDLSSVFGQMAGLGAGGCGFEQHLHAMKRALEPNNTANDGFIRDNAFLAVIFLADEDDCSAKNTMLWGADGGSLGNRQSFRCTRFGVTCDVGGATDQAMAQVGVKDQCHPNDNSAILETVSTFVQNLKDLKEDDQKIIVAGIIGTVDPFAVEMRTINGNADLALAHSCTYNPPGGGGAQVADPPIRLQFFLDQFPNRSTATTICQADLSGGLQLIGELLKESIGNPCITGKLLDTDAGAGGIQPDCTVSYIANFGKPNAQETPLPQCDAGVDPDNPPEQPCWRIFKDTTACPCNNTLDPDCNVANDFDNLVLQILDRITQPDGTQVVANCVTEA